MLIYEKLYEGLDWERTSFLEYRYRNYDAWASLSFLVNLGSYDRGVMIDKNNMNVKELLLLYQEQLVACVRFGERLSTTEHYVQWLRSIENRGIAIESIRGIVHKSRWS